MDKEEVTALIEEVFGRQGQLRAAAALGRNNVTISRWCCGVTPVRPMEEKLLRLILTLHRQGLDWSSMCSLTPGMTDDVEDLI